MWSARRGKFTTCSYGLPFNITRIFINKLISILCSLMVIYLADVVVIFRLFERFRCFSCLRRKTVYRTFGVLDNNLLGPLSLIRAYNNPGKELMLHLRRS